MLHRISATRHVIAAIAAELIGGAIEQHQGECRVNDAHITAVIEFND